MKVANALQNDLKASLNLGGEGMLAWLKPDFDLLPIGGYEAAHDTGRWWDAMLRLLLTQLSA